jgi:hypothetical protein
MSAPIKFVLGGVGQVSPPPALETEPPAADAAPDAPVTPPVAEE